MAIHRLVIFILGFAVSFILQNPAYSQDEDECCDDDDVYGSDEMSEEEWENQMTEYQTKKRDLQILLKSYDNEINNLKNRSSELDNAITSSDSELLGILGMNKSSFEEFRRKFGETEKKINNKLGTPPDARKMYFNEIEASKAKCLPEFYNRYLAMKSKLEAWEKETIVSKSDQYTVVKGDCLWKISGKSEIYGKNNYWPVLWEANQEGVISAPRSTPKKITNPNLIYPGQVLRVPVLTEKDLEKLKDVNYQVRIQRQADDLYKNRKSGFQGSTKIKKNTKGSVNKVLKKKNNTNMPKIKK